VWKRLDESISTSEKWAKLSWSTMGIGMYILANSDSKGRYSGDPRVIKARCMTYREDVRLETVEDALSELERERVLHIYHAGQKRYVVFHDCAEWNPTGALRYQDAKHPEPPSELCECLRRVHGVKTPPVTSVSSSSTSGGGGGEPPEPSKPPPPKPGTSPEALLVSHWNDQPKRNPISPAKGVRFVETAVAAGVPIQAIETAFWNQGLCAGKKIFDVLDDLKATHAKVSRREEFKQERDTHGPRKL
jgi:hypothetical protein